MKILVKPNELNIFGINKAIANMIPGSKYVKKGRYYTAPLSASTTLARTVPLKCPPELLKVAKDLEEKEKKVISLKKKGVDNKHPFLMAHQQMCLEIAKNLPSYAFFAETGTGKTLIGLSIINHYSDTKWVVVCPKTIIKPAWLEDANKFYPDMKIMPWKRGMRQKDIKPYKDMWGTNTPQHSADVLVCNYESFRLMTEEFLELGVKGVIFDESVKIKNPQASVTKKALEFCEGMDFVYLLTGIPAPNNELEYFTQMQAVDPAIFGTNYWRFRGTYFVAHDWFQRDWELHPAMKDKFMEQLSKRSIVIRKQDCLDLPPLVSVVRNIQLSPKVMRYYKEMHRDRVLDLTKHMKDTESTIIAPNKLTQLMKLRQITSGFIIDNEDVNKPLHMEKLSALLEVLEELGDEQAIIWCNFRNEIRKIKELLGDKAVTAYGETRDTNASIEDFKSGKAQYIIAHPQTLKYGVTLTNCTYAIFYSLSYSYDDFAQAKDRIHRYGQKAKATQIFLIAEDTIDEIIYQVLLGKKSKDEAIKEVLAV